MEKNANKKAAIGKVDVSKKVVRVQDLGDKIGMAINQFEAAQRKFEEGRDSYNEWKNIVKLLNLQIKDIQHFKAVAHHNMGVIHAGKKEFDKAEELFLAAIELDPEYAVAWYNLGVCYRHINNKPKFKECIEKARKMGYPPSA